MTDAVDRDVTTAAADPDPDSDVEERADDHLADVESGAGCTEIWEYLSERREE